MENKSIFGDNLEQQRNNLEIDWQIADYLREVAKWCKFLAILGFITIGFMVIGSFFIGSLFSNSLRGTYGAGISGSVISIFYLIISVIMFFPAFYLYKFSTDIPKSLDANSQELLSSGFKKLKSFFRFYGILSIISIIFYVIIILISLMSIAFI